MCEVLNNRLTIGVHMVLSGGCEELHFLNPLNDYKTQSSKSKIVSLSNKYRITYFHLWSNIFLLIPPNINISFVYSCSCASSRDSYSSTPCRTTRTCTPRWSAGRDWTQCGTWPPATARTPCRKWGSLCSVRGCCVGIVPGQQSPLK